MWSHANRSISPRGSAIASVAVVVVVVMSFLFTCAAPVRAAAPEQDDWRFNITPYLWLPSVSSNLHVSDLGPEVEADTAASDLFDKLDFALLLCGEVRKGKWGVLYDFQCLKLSDDGVVGPVDGRHYDAELTVADATLGLQYRVAEAPDFFVDAFGGARVMYADTSIDISPGVVVPAGASGGEDKAWVDPIIGLKGRWQFADHWSLLGYGDIGGFGVSSDLTYQLMGTVAYHFNDNVALLAGYRYFAVDYDRGGFELDAAMHGPIIGLSFTF
jgi:opacity protein-like surface antigen